MDQWTKWTSLPVDGHVHHRLQPVRGQQMNLEPGALSAVRWLCVCYVFGFNRESGGAWKWRKWRKWRAKSERGREGSRYFFFLVFLSKEEKVRAARGCVGGWSVKAQGWRVWGCTRGWDHVATHRGETQSEFHNTRGLFFVPREGGERHTRTVSSQVGEGRME